MITPMIMITHDHDDTHHDHHGLHDRDIASFCFIREEPITREALRLLLDALQQNLGANLLRVKGLINVAEEPDRPAVIQGAQHLLHNLAWLDRWPDADHRSKIVFITQNFERAEVEDMIAVLDRVAARTARRGQERRRRSSSWPDLSRPSRGGHMPKRDRRTSRHDETMPIRFTTAPSSPTSGRASCP